MMTIFLIISAVLAVVYVRILYTTGNINVFFTVAGIAAVELILLLILNIARKIYLNNPVFTKEQKDELQKAMEADAKQKEENAALKEQAFAQYTENLPAVKEQAKKDLAATKSELKQSLTELEKHLENYNNSTLLCEHDKNLKTVESLIYFLETGRAQTLNEALALFDTTAAETDLEQLQKQNVDLFKQNGINEQGVGITVQPGRTGLSDAYLQYAGFEKENGSLAKNGKSIVEKIKNYTEN